MPRRPAASSVRKATKARAGTKQPRKQKAPIAALSAETLARIFELFLQEPVTSGKGDTHWRLRLNRHAVLALVCRFWKKVLYGCKHLWNTIDMTRTTQSKLFLANSAGIPLRLEWDTSASRLENRVFPPFPWRTLKPLLNRIESFRIVWDVVRVNGQRENRVFPIVGLKLFTNSIKSLTMHDNDAAFRLLDGVQLPALRELEFRCTPRSDGTGEPLNHFKLHASGLTRLLLTRVWLDGRCLRELLQGCSALEELRLAYCEVEDATPLTHDSVALPHLKILALGGMRHATDTAAILCAIQDLRSTIYVDFSNSDFRDITGKPVFQRRFIPFHLTRMEVTLYHTLVLTGEPRESAPTFVITLNNIGTIYGATRPTPQALDSTLFHKIPLDLLQLRAKVPMELLPPFSTAEVDGSTAPLLFEWLREHASDECAHQIECIVLKDVQLILGDPDDPPEFDTLSCDEIFRWKDRTRTFSDLQNVLRARHEAGSPVRLVFRSGDYDNDLMEALRPFARELEVDPACHRGRRSSRVALKQK